MENPKNHDLDGVILSSLQTVIEREASALEKLLQEFPFSAIELVKKIISTPNRIVFSGVGKSGLIARKLVATFASMGIPALFLHPNDALHGDLGAVRHDDLFIILSKSGTGSEFEQIVPLLSLQGNQSALICCAQGSLTSVVNLVVRLPFDREACDLNLAPTSSSTLMLAFGDALAVTVASLKGFKRDDFARFHPAGAIGKSLLLTSSAFMHKQNTLPLLSPHALFKEIILSITSKKLGVGIVVDNNNHLLGIITDGDLRRACNTGPEVFAQKACDIMTLHPKTISEHLPVYEALEIMENFNITSLIVTDDDSVVVGLLHIHDLMRAGICRANQ